jgi:hyperosmotically inducible periplasmic protein
MQFRHIDAALMIAAMTAVVPASQAADTPRSAAEAGMTAGQYIDDATLTTKVKTALVSDSITSLFKISVTSNKGTVTLNGAVDKPETIERAIKLASAVPGVKEVNAQLSLKVN